MPTNSLKHRGAKSPKPAKGQAGKATQPQRAGKRARNLSLTGEAIARGEAYSAARGTTLSAVVEQFLRALPAPVDVGDEELDPEERQRREIEYARAHTTSPLVRELAGILANSDFGDQDPRELYREHLWRKYGE